MPVPEDGTGLLAGGVDPVAVQEVAACRCPASHVVKTSCRAVLDDILFCVYASAFAVVRRTTLARSCKP